MNRVTPMLGGLFLMLAMCLSAAAQQPGPVPGNVPLAPAVEAPAKVPKNLLQTFYDGGPLMYPIALCSFLVVMFTCERIITLRRSRVIPRDFVTRIFEQIREGQLDREDAIALCEKNGSPVAIVLAGGLKKWGRPAVEVEQAILDSGERVCNQLRKYLRLFNGVSQVAPLFGLLGTVMGMISSFQGISGSAAAGQRELMAGGIAEALITTASGMFVAIPALLAYLHFLSRVDYLVTEIDSVGQRLVDLISADGLERAARERAPKKKAA
ncbi:MotA/TolQ/ExbB proton channel family protein [Anatilimnocola floriformis]|uniref:MotA/TolQ/ExbB proton channel family protein n=1 Tax=Anatilimnocola floriformis TaxID=2948575 RepID=UPI0020C52238|nr:MotA/TolQ/ExbB proton channel family protein [Anatilimnocola floriformis]